MTKTETLNLRVSSEFKRRLSEEAAKEHAQSTNYIEATLTAVGIELRQEKPRRKATVSVKASRWTRQGRD